MDRDDIQEDCAFSIMYSESLETLNLVAFSPDEANIWVTGLRCLIDSDKGTILLLFYLHPLPLNCCLSRFITCSGELQENTWFSLVIDA